ncbi:MAG: XdhC family protein, partial [Rhodospirillales bacterium]|nr:XdhC family protein [Rhodospirillales bacterium]
MDDDGSVLAQAVAWIEAGMPAALATVVSTWGSAPRPVGSHMAVAGDGAFLGSVSGGCVEAAVVREALDVLAECRPRLLRFGI